MEGRQGMGNDEAIAFFDLFYKMLGLDFYLDAHWTVHTQRYQVFRYVACDCAISTWTDEMLAVSSLHFRWTLVDESDQGGEGTIDWQYAPNHLLQR